MATRDLERGCLPWQISLNRKSLWVSDLFLAATCDTGAGLTSGPSGKFTMDHRPPLPPPPTPAGEAGRALGWTLTSTTSWVAYRLQKRDYLQGFSCPIHELRAYNNHDVPGGKVRYHINPTLSFSSETGGLFLALSPELPLGRLPTFSIITCAISDFPQSRSGRAGTTALKRLAMHDNSFLFLNEFRKDLNFLPEQFLPHFFLIAMFLNSVPMSQLGDFK